MSVRVTEPQTDSVKGFVTYLVSGTDELGTFEIRRRYNDFFYLRESLHKKWPGIYIPPIPEKKFTVPDLLSRETKMEKISKQEGSFLSIFLSAWEKWSTYSRAQRLNNSYEINLSTWKKYLFFDPVFPDLSKPQISRTYYLIQKEFHIHRFLISQPGRCKGNCVEFRQFSQKSRKVDKSAERTGAKYCWSKECL